MAEKNGKREGNGDGVATSGFPGWPRKRNRPMNPPVTAIFVGLVAFSYSRTNRRAEIVFNDGDNRHNLQILATENGDPVQLDLPSPIRRISLGLASSPSVFFLDQTSRYSFDHLIDLNSDGFYPGMHPARPFGIKLVVNHGTFYTKKLTKCQFGRVLIVDGFPPVGASAGKHYAEQIGVEFELATNEQLALVVNGSPVKQFPTQSGRTTTIVFDNECTQNAARCIHRPYSWFERQRGDFHYHRHVLPLIGDLPYGLLFTGCPDLIKSSDPVVSNDRSPCMGAGYSGSDGLPGS